MLTSSDVMVASSDAIFTSSDVLVASSDAVMLVVRSRLLVVCNIDQQ